MKCNTVFISSICYYLFILFLALRSIGKNIYIYIFPTAKSALLLFFYIYIFSFAQPSFDLARPLSAFLDYFLRVCQSLLDSFL